MIGQTFAPLSGGDPTEELRRRQQAAGGPLGNVGQAIRTLNLRMPRVQGAAAIAPSLLLNSRGSAGLPPAGSNPVIDAILRGILGNFIPPRQVAPSAPGGSMSPTGTLPPPQIIPGVDEGQGSQRETSYGGYTPPTPAHPGPTEPREFPEHTRENAIIGGGFQVGRGFRY